jgi:hypothetical protein
MQTSAAMCCATGWCLSKLIICTSSRLLLFDFALVYDKAFEDALYGAELDYSQLPDAFETYSQEDQTRIKQRMTTLQ